MYFVFQSIQRLGESDPPCEPKLGSVLFRVILCFREGGHPQGVSGFRVCIYMYIDSYRYRYRWDWSHSQGSWVAVNELKK